MNKIQIDLEDRLQESNSFCPIHKEVKTNIVIIPKGINKGKRHEVCPRCVVEGISQEEQEKVRMKLKVFEENETIALFERESDLSEELDEADFSTFEVANDNENRMKFFAEQVERYYEQGGSGNTLFMGNSGVGKSHLAISMLKRLNKYHKDFHQNKSVLFISVEAMMGRIKNTFGMKESLPYDEENTIRLLTDVDYLVLDDLGTESKMSRRIDDSNDWIQRVLFKILDKRNTTIITTNLTESEIRKIYNNKLVSRIFKNSNNKIFLAPTSISDKRKLRQLSIPFVMDEYIPFSDESAIELKEASLKDVEVETQLSDSEIDGKVDLLTTKQIVQKEVEVSSVTLPPMDKNQTERALKTKYSFITDEEMEKIKQNPPETQERLIELFRIARTKSEAED